MLKRIAAVFAAFVIAVTFATPAEAAARAKDVVVKSDPTPTYLYITYDLAQGKPLLKCVNVQTTYGRTRAITVRAYNGKTYRKTLVKDLKIGNRDLHICINRVSYRFPTNYQPNIRITVVEDIPGPLNPTGRGTVTLN